MEKILNRLEKRISLYDEIDRPIQFTAVNNFNSVMKRYINITPNDLLEIKKKTKKGVITKEEFVDQIYNCSLFYPFKKIIEPLSDDPDDYSDSSLNRYLEYMDNLIAYKRYYFFFKS